MGIGRGDSGESRGLPSCSGSGMCVSRDFCDQDRARTELCDQDPERNETCGEVANPPGEKPPDLAALFTPRIEFDAFEVGVKSRLKGGGDSSSSRWVSSIEDLRLSLRLSESFCSSFNLRNSSPISEDMLSRSALRSRRSTFPM